MTSIHHRLLAAFAIFFFTLPAGAQSLGPMQSSDLNNDGRVERFTLIDNGNGSADLQIENTGSGVLYAQNIVWAGGIGQIPSLSLAPNGSVKVHSQNDSIGRYRWSQVLTIAYRQGQYRVAGFTYSWRDTLNLPDNGTCDLNLLSGRGVVTIDNGPQRNISTSMAARPITQWSDDIAPSPECGAS